MHSVKQRSPAHIRKAILKHSQHVGAQQAAEELAKMYNSQLTEGRAVIHQVSKAAGICMHRYVCSRTVPKRIPHYDIVDHTLSRKRGEVDIGLVISCQRKHLEKEVSVLH